MNIAVFHDHLYGQGKAERTIAEYCKWVRRASRWATERGCDLATMQAYDLRRWADTTIPNTWASRKQARSALAHYYRAAGRQDAPWEAIRVPRQPRQRPKPLAPSDATLLRDAAILYGGRPGLATLALMYTAQRPSETAVLRWDGIADGRIKWWRTKTSEWHEVPLHPTLAKALDGYRTPDAEGFVFVGNNGRPHVTPTTVWGWVGKVSATIGLHVTPRTLRSTAGCMALEATRDLDAAAELLGHRDVAVTRLHYTLTSARRLEAAVEALDYGRGVELGDTA